jgi:hypothetical protein
MADNNIKWTDITKDPNWTGGINPNGMYTNTATRTPVLCKDGTTDFSLSSSNAKYDNTKVCANNGGRAENQPTSVKPTTEDIKQQNLKLEKIGDVLTAEDKFYEKLGIKYHNTHMFGRPSRTKGRLLVAVVLVAGYFAYKKFKK